MTALLTVGFLQIRAIFEVTIVWRRDYFDKKNNNGYDDSRFSRHCLGCAIYAFGLVTINIQNHLAEGGLTGVTLILRYWFHFDPAYTTIVLNIPLIILGYRFLGKRALAYTIYGTAMMSVFLWIWQRVPIMIDLNHDILIASILPVYAAALAAALSTVTAALLGAAT